MSTYVICPNRKNKKVSLEVCLKNCKEKNECQEFAEVPRNEIDQILAKNHNPDITPGSVVISGKFGTHLLEEKDPEEASHLLERAISIKNEIDMKFWEMGSILHDIFQNQYYVDYGYKDWKDFCEKVLDIKWRTATYLRDIFVKMTSLGIQSEDCVGIGWGKLKELLPVIDKENVKGWLDRAKKKDISVAVLNAKVKVALGKMTEEEAKKLPSPLMFRLYEDQLANVERALELARRMLSSESRSFQLETICIEFRATYETVEENYSKLKLARNLLGRVESSLAVAFKGEIVDVSTGEIIRETA